MKVWSTVIFLFLFLFLRVQFRLYFVFKGVALAKMEDGRWPWWMMVHGTLYKPQSWKFFQPWWHQHLWKWRIKLLNILDWRHYSLLGRGIVTNQPWNIDNIIFIFLQHGNLHQTGVFQTRLLLGCLQGHKLVACSLRDTRCEHPLRASPLLLCGSHHSRDENHIWNLKSACVKLLCRLYCS